MTHTTEPTLGGHTPEQLARALHAAIETDSLDANPVEPWADLTDDDRDHMLRVSRDAIMRLNLTGVL